MQKRATLKAVIWIDPDVHPELANEFVQLKPAKRRKRLVALAAIGLGIERAAEGGSPQKNGRHAAAATRQEGGYVPIVDGDVAEALGIEM